MARHETSPAFLTAQDMRFAGNSVRSLATTTTPTTKTKTGTTV